MTLLESSVLVRFISFSPIGLSFTHYVLYGIATLVVGPTDAHVVYNDPIDSLALSEDCAINNGVAVCTAVASVAGVVTTDVETETASGFVVQGNTATAAATGANSGSAAATGSAGSNTAAATGSSATAGSAATSGASQTGSAGASQTSASGNGNGAGRMGASMGLSLGVVGLVSAFFL